MMDRPESHETEMSVDFFTNDTDHFSHGESRQYGSNAKSPDASQTDEGNQCGCCQTDDIKGYFNF